LPFGDEIIGLGQRTPEQGYGMPDGVRKKFTGYEKDQETGLDFAQARYYGNGLGRFTSVDPLLESAKLGLPQSWNRYSYVLNNPIALSDPSGECTNGVNCPTNYSGPVYTKTINGSVRYNNERPDDSWSLFTGVDYFRDEIDGGFYQVTGGGWRPYSFASSSDIGCVPSYQCAGLSLQQDREGIRNALIGAEIGTRNFINSPVTTNLVCPACRPFGFDTSLRSFGVPLIVGERHPENTAQSVSALGTEIGLSVLTAKAIGSFSRFSFSLQTAVGNEAFFVRAQATNGAKLSYLTDGELFRILNFADKRNTTIILFGSRAKGTATSLSDWDYVIDASYKIRNNAKIMLPRGAAGTHRIDVIHPKNLPFDISDQPQIIFRPRPQ
jgi:RHS repeat-associated protein